MNKKGGDVGSSGEIDGVLDTAKIANVTARLNRRTSDRRKRCGVKDVAEIFFSAGVGEIGL